MRTFPEFSVEWLAQSLRKTFPENHVSVDVGGVVQPFMGWVGNEEVDINWDVSSDSSPITVLSPRGEFNKEKRKSPNGLCPQIADFEQPLEGVDIGLKTRRRAK